MSSLPPLPPGFVLEPTPPANLPPLPDGFVLDGGPAAPAIDARPNLSGVPLFGPALGAAGFDGVPRVDEAPDAWAEPGVLFPAQHNRKTGAWRPAVPQIIDSLVDAIMAPSDALSGKMNEIEIDPETGAVAPFNTQMIERAANAAGWATGGAPGGKVDVLTAAGRKVPAPVVRAVNADGVPISQVAARVNTLGPEGTVADLGPSLQAQASALAALPDQSADALIDTMRLRKGSASTRIRSGLDETLGPAPIPSKLLADIRAAKRVVGPDYDKVLATAPPIDLMGLAELLDGKALTRRGPAQAALRDVRAMLNGADGELETSAAVLHQIREAVDGMLENPPDGNTRTVLKSARDSINDLLTEAVPAIQTVDSKYRELARQSEAVERGQVVLDSNRSAPRPVELADEMKAGALPEGVLVGPSGAAFRLSQGTRAEIDRIVGTNINDRAALARILRGDGDWNRQRLVTLFGEERANRLFQILENERRMAETETAVLRAGGRRADAAAQSEIAPEPKGPGALQSALNLRPGSAAAKVLDDVAGGHRQRRQSTMNDSILEELLGRGEWQAVDGRPMSQMPVPVESWLAEIFGRSEEAPPRQSRPDPAVIELLLRL